MHCWVVHRDLHLTIVARKFGKMNTADVHPRMAEKGCDLDLSGTLLDKHEQHRCLDRLQTMLLRTCDIDV